MIPSNSWFPQSLADRAAWYQNFATQFVTFAPILGFAADIPSVNNDNEVFQWLADQTVTVEAFRSAVVEWRVSLTEGDIGDPAPVYPGQTFDPPPLALAAGMFERLDKLRKRILASATYTDEIGVQLGIVSEGGVQTISPGDVQPEIQVFAAATGYVFSIVVSKRYDADQWQVWATPAGEQKWASIATATGKSTDVEYAPADAADNPAPVQLQVRVQLRRSNQDYGIPSLIAQVTVNP